MVADDTEDIEFTEFLDEDDLEVEELDEPIDRKASNKKKGKRSKGKSKSKKESGKSKSKSSKKTDKNSTPKDKTKSSKGKESKEKKPKKQKEKKPMPEEQDEFAEEVDTEPEKLKKQTRKKSKKGKEVKGKKGKKKSKAKAKKPKKPRFAKKVQLTGKARKLPIEEAAEDEMEIDWTFDGQTEEENALADYERNRLQEQIKFTERERINLSNDLVYVKADLHQKDKMIEEFKKDYERLRDDFDKYKKRMRGEIKEKSKFASEKLIEEILDVLDNFDRTNKLDLATLEKEDIFKGVQMIYNQLMDTMNKDGLKIIEAEGEPFDPYIHEAVATTKTDEHPNNTILEELQKGYKYKGKVLRATKVRVSQSSIRPEIPSKRVLEKKKKERELKEKKREEKRKKKDKKRGKKKDMGKKAKKKDEEKDLEMAVKDDEKPIKKKPKQKPEKTKKKMAAERIKERAKGEGEDIVSKKSPGSEQRKKKKKHKDLMKQVPTDKPKKKKHHDKVRKESSSQESGERKAGSHHKKNKSKKKKEI